MFELKNGDALEVLKTLPDSSVHCCVTSPPYWGLRDYGHDGQIGLESTPEAYVARMVEVFREVRRVLRDDGTCWVNLGDSYAASGIRITGRNDGDDGYGVRTGSPKRTNPYAAEQNKKTIITRHNLKPKDLVGIPWRVAFALQADGWYLRQDIIWHKPNPMPESVRDRCTKAHEYVFLLTKSGRYYYDAEAVSEASVAGPLPGNKKPHKGLDVDPSRHRTRAGLLKHHETVREAGGYQTRNRRSVWTITPKPYKGAHFAVMPPDLVEPCIKAGCPVGGTVLDPFAGSGTTLAVATKLGRNSIGIELNAEYIELAQARIQGEIEKPPLFTGQA
jgi:DNA modification methylase